MKTTAISLSLFFAICSCTARNKGSVISKEVKPRAGMEIHYIYLPPTGLLIPETLQALVVYESKQQYYQKTIPVSKTSNGYLFSFKAPDSTAVLIFSFVDAKKEVLESSSLVVANKIIVDNNNEAGFNLYLHDKQGKRFVFENVRLASLLGNFARYRLQLKPLSNKILIKMYEGAYSLYPELRKEDSYLDYLTFLYKEKLDAVKPKLLAYAKQLIQIQTDETKWLNAKRIYTLLKMNEERDNIENKILSVYPDGQEAKQKFWDNLYNQKYNTEQSTLDFMDVYIGRFKDSSVKVKDNFYNLIVQLLLDKKEWDGLLKYENLIHDKLIIPYNYDYFAWNLSGKQLSNAGSDLQIIKMLSKKSLDVIEELMKNPVSVNEYDEDLEGVRNMFLNTYSLILYKLAQYDSAFYYQDVIYKKGKKLLNTEGLERYTAYAEKVKGINYTKSLIEDQLLSGINSPAMVKQLKSIYKQLNLPEDEFNKLQKNWVILTKQKTAKIIKAKYGRVEAPGFTMKNIFGDNVSLSSFKNKIVVLDFWATWCGPCKASFPVMQEIVNKYKDDKEVVFLFIDVHENMEFLKIKNTVAKFLKDNNYSFNVLFDVRDKVINAYKVEGIPTKFVIDKQGNIVYMGDSSNIAVEIENAKD